MNGNIQIDNLCKKYAGGIVALQPTSVAIPTDQAVGIIGENGSGKSTFIKLLSGYLKPDSGSVQFKGLSPFRQAAHFRRKLGYLAQDTQLDPEMTGHETLALFAAFYAINGQKQKQRIQELGKEYGLEEHLHQTIKRYSGGLRQRLHLALSLVHDPDFLILDEPTNALDAAGKKMLWQQIRRRAKQGRTTLIVSHDLFDIEKHCDHILLFHQGKLLLEGPPRQLVEQDNAYRLVYFVDGKIEQSKLQTQFLGLPGIRRMDVGRDQILFSIDNQFEDMDQQIQRMLQQTGLTILESRKRKTDLSTLYFNLTGSTGEQKQKGKKKRRNR